MCWNKIVNDIHILCHLIKFSNEENECCCWTQMQETAMEGKPIALKAVCWLKNVFISSLLYVLPLTFVFLLLFRLHCCIYFLLYVLCQSPTYWLKSSFVFFCILLSLTTLKLLFVYSALNPFCLTLFFCLSPFVL